MPQIRGWNGLFLDYSGFGATKSRKFRMTDGEGDLAPNFSGSLRGPGYQNVCPLVGAF